MTLIVLYLLTHIIVTIIFYDYIIKDLIILYIDNHVTYSLLLLLFLY